MIASTTSRVLDDIDSATTPSDLFSGDPTNSEDARRARRTYRTLIALIHPDLLAASGITAQESHQVTARLNQLYAQWQAIGPSAGDAGPHVSGRSGTYQVRSRIAQFPLLSTFATDDPRLFIDISRTPLPATDDLVQVSQRLVGKDLGAFVPEVIDHGTTSERAWAAYRTPDGLYSLRQVRDAFPGGLDGRDWAWIARRILIVLAAAEIPHGAIDLDTVAIHPEQHGVVISGWGAHPRPADGRADLAALGTLFRQLLARTEMRQLAFIAGACGLSAARVLREYDLLLRVCYGPRRFRPLAMPTGIA